MKDLIEFRTIKEGNNTTILEARLRLTARTYIPNEYIIKAEYPNWLEKVVRKQLSDEINNKLYGEITDKLIDLTNKISKMIYSDYLTRIYVVEELNKYINEIIHSYEER